MTSKKKKKNGVKILLKAGKKNKAAVFLGGSNVTVGDGFPIDPGEWIWLPSVDYELLYCIGTAGDTLHLLIWS